MLVMDFGLISWACCPYAWLVVRLSSNYQQVLGFPTILSLYTCTWNSFAFPFFFSSPYACTILFQLSSSYTCQHTESWLQGSHSVWDQFTVILNFCCYPTNNLVQFVWGGGGGGGGGGICQQLFCFSIEESRKWLLVEEVASKLAVWSSLFIGLCLPMFWDCQANDTDQSCKEAVSALCTQPQLCVKLEQSVHTAPVVVKLEPALCIQPQLCVKLEPALCIQPQLCVKLEPTLCIQPQLCVKPCAYSPSCVSNWNQPCAYSPSCVSNWNQPCAYSPSCMSNWNQPCAYSPSFVSNWNQPCAYSPSFVSNWNQPCAYSPSFVSNWNQPCAYSPSCVSNWNHPYTV